MSVSLEMKGFKELERALAKLPASTAKGVARRVMKKSLKPVAETANALWPGAEDPFRVTSKLARGQRKAGFVRSVVEMYVGADVRSNTGAPHAHLVEFGTGPRRHKSGKHVGAVAPQPMLQPAWDMHREAILRNLARDLWAEIEKSLARRAAKEARAA